MPKRPLVLVVEDHLDLNDLERELLAQRGLDSVAAYTGMEALSKFRDCEPDAVLLDLMMPELDGYEVCRRLRRLADRVPIVVVSALDGTAERQRATDVGANAYFDKPFNSDVLAATIKSLIAQLQGTRESKAPEGREKLPYNGIGLPPLGEGGAVVLE